MLYPHLIHKVNDNYDTMDIMVVVAQSNLTYEDFSWTGMAELKEGTYVPTPDLILQENVFHFSSLIHAQRFITMWWMTYMKVQQEADTYRATPDISITHFLTCK